MLKQNKLFYIFIYARENLSFHPRSLFASKFSAYQSLKVIIYRQREMKYRVVQDSKDKIIFVQDRTIPKFVV